MSQFEVISPVDGSVYYTGEYTTQANVDANIKRAAEAQIQWRRQSLRDRQKACTEMVNAMVENGDELAEQICWQMGRPIQYCRGEVNGLEQRSRYMIEAAEQALADIEIENSEQFQRFIRREPLGVVLVISPWNYPFLTAVNSVVPALLAGNAVLLKASRQTPLCAEQFRLAAQRAGLPDGILQVLHLDHEATAGVIASDQVQHVAFTGSVEGGRQIERVAAGHFKSVGLELGGKDPAYVRKDADIAAAVATVIDGAYFNSGQSCCGIERIYVHKDIHDEFVKQAVAMVRSYQLLRSDDPECTLGPLVNAKAADFVRGQIQEAIAQGAIAHISEVDFPLSKVGSAYLAPQLLTEVDHSMRIMTEESFGPVVGIQRVESDEEAIALMNDSAFGLSAVVCTQNEVKGLEIGEQLNTGTFFINRCDYLDPALAWTGVKHSGRGCTLSTLGLQALTRPKSFHIKRPDVP